MSKYSFMADYHTHSPLCKHALGEVWQYAERARDLGLAEFGCSDHMPSIDGFNDRYAMQLESMDDYIEMVEEARRRVPQIPIRLGIECDYHPKVNKLTGELLAKYNFDYVLGSIHFIGDSPHTIHAAEAFEGSTVEEMWSKYYEQWGEATESGLFDIMSHPDLIKYCQKYPEGDLSRFYRPALEKCAASQVTLEVNTSGLRKPVKEIYPSEAFLKMAFELNIPICISSDAHRPEDIGAGFDEALELVKRVGYKELAHYQGRIRKMVPIKIS